MKPVMFFVSLLIVSCSIFTKRDIEVKNGLFVLFGTSDLTKTELFIEGDFKRSTYIKDLSETKEVIAEQYVLSDEQFYELLTAADTVYNSSKFKRYTWGEIEIFTIPVVIKYKKFISPKRYHDPTNVETITKMKINNELITIKSKYSEKKIIEVKIKKW